MRSLVSLGLSTGLKRDVKLCFAENGRVNKVNKWIVMSIGNSTCIHIYIYTCLIWWSESRHLPANYKQQYIQPVFLIPYQVAEYSVSGWKEITFLSQLNNAKKSYVRGFFFKCILSFQIFFQCYGFNQSTVECVTAVGWCFLHLLTGSTQT